MSPGRARFVTASQQVLALAVVLVALAPATRVLSLDVVAVNPGHPRPVHQAGLRSAWSGPVGDPLGGRDLVEPGW